MSKYQGETTNSLMQIIEPLFKYYFNKSAEEENNIVKVMRNASYQTIKEEPLESTMMYVTLVIQKLWLGKIE